MNGKNVEAAVVAAAPFSSFYRMQSNSDNHRQHQICLEREIKKTERKRERECVRVKENWWVLELELNFRIVKSKSKKKGIWKKGVVLYNKYSFIQTQACSVK